MRARQLMRAPVITVHADATVKEAADLMAAHNISGMPVVDASNRLVGILSESDILMSVDQHGRAPGVVEQLRDAVRGHEAAPPPRARDLMRRRVITAGPEATFRELLHLMLAHRINRIPIVDGDQIVGIVTRADLLRTIARPDAAIASDARARILHDLWIDPSALTISTRDGVLTVSGQLGTRSEAELVTRWLAATAGVVDVDTSGLTYRVDDRRGPDSHTPAEPAVGGWEILGEEERQRRERE